MNASLSRHKPSYIFGRERKDRIVEAIKNGTVMNTPQVQTLFFNNLKPASAKRKCQEIMKELVDKERVKSYHSSKTQFIPAIYYLDQKPKNYIHFLLINEVLCEFISQKPNLFKIEWKWSYLIYNGLVISDAMITILYDPDGRKKQVIFLEVERDPRKHFDKDKKYQKIYDMDWHKDLPEWVVVEENKAIFPTVLIITDKTIENLKQTDVNFIIATSDQVSEDVYKLIWKK